MQKLLICTILLSLLLAGCQQKAATPEATQSSVGMGMRQGAGMSSGMRDRHHASIPAEYASAASDIQPDQASLQRGEELFALHCVTCHGEDGMGTGPAAPGLNPAPAPIARTSQMMGDSYLLWRISEGGVPFETQMPAWKDTLSQADIWDVVNYVRALGAGTVAAGGGMGGQAAEAQAAQHAEMLANGIEQGIITQAEADTFELVHTALESYLAENPPAAGGMDDHRDTAFSALVAAGTLTQEQVDTFNAVHDRLVESGLME